MTRPRLFEGESDDFRRGFHAALTKFNEFEARQEADKQKTYARNAEWLARRRFGFCGERWCCYFWFVGWDCLSLGLHVCLSAPNLELHLPFGFIRAGRIKVWKAN